MVSDWVQPCQGGGRVQRVVGALLAVAEVAQIVYCLFWLGGREALGL